MFDSVKNFFKPPVPLPPPDPDSDFPPKDGVEKESCSAKDMKLSRFSSWRKFYRANEKSKTELLLNPFGDPWITREAPNPAIPTMTGSLLGYMRKQVGDVAVPMMGKKEVVRAYTHYSGYSISEFHYDENVGRLNMNMPEFRKMRDLYRTIGLTKNFIAYAVLNYDDHNLFGKHSGLPEEYFVHKPEDSRDPKDRLNFVDGQGLIAHGHVFDIRRPEVRTTLCERVLEMMMANDVGTVLIDYAVRRYAFGSPHLVHDMPEGWFPNFQEHQINLFKELFELLDQNNKKLLLNGTMLDSILVTEPTMVRQFTKNCHGMMWEQPFRWEWRNYNKDGEDYYERLDRFFENSHNYKRHHIIKSGTYRFHGSEDVIPGWTTRFKKTNYGIERHLAEYATCFFLLYADRRYDALYHTHPTAVYDIYSSEPYFNIWATDIGEALTKRVPYSKHVHIREFENAFVCLNNTSKRVKLSPETVEGQFSVPLPAATLKPVSGTIIMKDKAADPEDTPASN